MNLRDRREPVDHLDALLRHSLRECTAHKGPMPQVRQTLMQRAAVQRRRLVWRLPFSFRGLFSGNPFRLASTTTHYQVPYFEAFFGPRLNWYTLNQLMR